MSTLADAAAMPVADVATRLGMELRRSPSADSAPCPACGAATRHARSHDKRGACGLPRAHPTRWRCFCCDAAGDGLDFAAYALAGRRFRELDSARRAEVYRWFEDRGVGGSWHPAPPRPPEPPRYPPRDDVAALWRACGPVAADRAVAAYLAFRGLDADRVAELDLARALPATGLPPWAGGVSGERRWTWAESRHRLIVPLYDHHGAMRSLIARSIDRAPRLKSLPPYGYERGGLVMADALGRGMLEHGRPPKWWRDGVPFDVAVYEGEVDLLAAATVTRNRAVLGVVSGSWTAAIAARIPAGSHVVLATDADAAGDRYAATITASLDGRATCERVR